MFKWRIYVHGGSLPLVLSMSTTEKNLAPSSCHPPFAYLYTLIRHSESSLLEANSPISQTFLTGEMLQSFNNFCVLEWSLSSMSMSLSYWGDQNWAPHSKCVIRSAEDRDKITSLQLLATLLLRWWRVINFTLHYTCKMQFSFLKQRIFMPYMPDGERICLRAI